MTFSPISNGVEITPEGFLGDHAGGVLGGISPDQDIRANIALKPTSSLRLPGRGIDVEGNPVEVVTHGRHNPCVGIRATPITEAMVAIVLMDHLIRLRAQNSDAEPPAPVTRRGTPTAPRQVDDGRSASSPVKAPYGDRHLGRRTPVGGREE